MKKFFASLKDSFQNAMRGVEPLSPAEERLYLAVTSLNTLKSELKARVTSLPEESDEFDLHKQQDVTCWSFGLLLQDRLQEKGWPVYPQEGRDAWLHSTLDVMLIQSESYAGKRNFELLVSDFKSAHSERKNALKFLCEHVGDLEDVINALKTFQPADLNNRHLVVFAAAKPAPVIPPPVLPPGKFSS